MSNQPGWYLWFKGDNTVVRFNSQEKANRFVKANKVTGEWVLYPPGAPHIGGPEPGPGLALAPSYILVSDDDITALMQLGSSMVQVLSVLEESLIKAQDVLIRM